MDPPLKKMKTEETVLQTIDSYIQKMKETSNNLHAVLSSDFTDPIPLLKVYAGQVKNPKDLSQIILTLNNKIPLKELSHLKRVRKKEVLLCPVNFLNGISIQEFLEENNFNLGDVFEYFREIDVPMYAPKVKHQCSHVTWSLNFHPNKYNERLVSDKFFSTEELKLHKTYMEIVFNTTKWYIERNLVTKLFDINVTLIVDPEQKCNRIVAVGCNNDHPVQHSAMVAIDNVAKTQKGGAWNAIPESKYSSYNLNGIEEDLFKFLKQLYPNVQFGSRDFVQKHANCDGPYLCTGYDVYMLREPCVMCSMGLVHARAKRIFFTLPNERLGGVKSVCKLQSIASLNHRFEVFTGFVQ